MANDERAAELEEENARLRMQLADSIEETDMNDTVRVFRAGSVFGNLVDLIIHPNKETDADVGRMLKKVKGTWKWATPAPGEVDSLPPYGDDD